MTDQAVTDQAPTAEAAPSRAGLRAAIDAEIARQGAHPIARRTLALIAEASLDPSEAEPGYRVVARDGEAAPASLAELVTALRARHPALFPAPEPEPEPNAEPEPAEPSPLAKASAKASAEVREATARLVETGSASARSLMARSIARARALKSTAAGAWQARRAAAGTVPAGPGRRPSARLDARIRRGGRRLAIRARVQGERSLSAASRLRRDFQDQGGVRGALGRPPALIGLGALALVGLVALGRGGDPDEAPATQAPVAQAPAPQTQAEGGAKAAPDAEAARTAEPRPEEAAADAAKPDAPPKSDELSGPAEVIDTATLRVGGKLVRLFGVEWVRGGQSEELSRYLSGRPVTCQPVAGSEARLCSVEGRDLSEVVLFNGGGRASSEATPDLVAAEDRARTERLGVWAR